MQKPPEITLRHMDPSPALEATVSERAAHGRVPEPEQDYGRLETADGRNIYFHRHSLVDADFDDLAIGTELRFVEEAGENGAQASSVFVMGKHHPVP